MRWMFLISVLFSSAMAAAVCTPARWQSGHADVTVSKMADGMCYVDVTSTYEPGLLYRDYMWDSTGALMVFNSYGPGNESTHTGAQDYVFFPHNVELGAEKAANGDVIVHAASGQTFTISAVTAQLTELSNGTVSIQAVALENKGGISFPTYNGLMMDGGFAFGHDPIATPSGKVSFRDAAGTVCTVGTSEVYKNVNGDPNIIQSTDEGMKAWLKNRCPKLNPGF